MSARRCPSPDPSRTAMPQPPPPYLEAVGARPYGEIRIPSGVIRVFRDPGGRLYTDDPDVGGPFRHTRSLHLAIYRRFGYRAQLEVTQDGAPSPALAEDPLPLPLPLPPPSDRLVASVAESASALTLQESEVSSLEVLHDYVSSDEYVTDSDDSTDSTDEEESVDDLSLGWSEILIREPPKWYQVFFIRTDSSGLFHMYPDLGGPFQSLDQAEYAISQHLAELQSRSVFKEQGTYSIVDRRIHEYNYYPDGTPKRGPNSRRRTNPNEEQHYLVQALLDQYNESKNLFGNLALELESLLRYKLIYGKKLYYHFNFTTKTGNLFFAEVSQIEGEGAWKVTCCCVIDSNENGQCNTCRNDGCPDMKHPNNTGVYTAGRLNGYFQYGDGELSELEYDDIEAEAARLRVVLKDLDNPDAMKKTQRLCSIGSSAEVCREPKDLSGVNGLMLDHNHYYSDRTSKSSLSSRESIDAHNEWCHLIEADDIFFGVESSGCGSDAPRSSQGPSEPHSDISQGLSEPHSDTSQGPSEPHSDTSQGPEPHSDSSQGPSKPHSDTNHGSVVANSDREVSWKDRLFHGQNLMPKQVRHQRNRPSCVFEALSAASEIEKKRLAAKMDPPQECDISFSTNSFIRDYEKIAGPLGSDQELYRRTRREKALEILRDKGVRASENGGMLNRQNISSYEWREDVSQISDIIDSGKPIVGTIPIDSYFPRLKADEIYDFDPKKAKMRDDGEVIRHAVVFVGYGVRGGRDYLVFLNSFGPRFGDEGYARVYLDHVRRLNTIEF